MKAGAQPPLSLLSTTFTARPNLGFVWVRGTMVGLEGFEPPAHGLGILGV